MQMPRSLAYIQQANLVIHGVEKGTKLKSKGEVRP